MSWNAHNPRHLITPPLHGENVSLSKQGVFNIGETEQTEKFNSPDCRTLLEYWRRRAGDRGLPAVTDIVLMDIYEVAPRVTLKDVVDGGLEFRHRYWGTDLTYGFGLDATGLLHKDFIAAEHLERSYEINRLAMRAEAPVRFAGCCMAEGREYVSFEAIFLPLLAKDRESVGHILALFDFSF